METQDERMTRFQESYLAELQGQNTQPELIERLILEADWEFMANVEVHLGHALNELSGVLTGFIEQGLEIDYSRWKLEFESKLEHELDIMIGSEKTMSLIGNLLVFSRDLVWNEEVVREIIARGRYILNATPQIHEITILGETFEVKYRRSVEVIPGEVLCDEYDFLDKPNLRDLGGITIEAGCSTKEQKVVGGDMTYEFLAKGQGKITVRKKDGQVKVYEFDGPDQQELIIGVEKGDTMQCIADPDSRLIVFEICFPPYADDRYIDLDQQTL